MSHITTCCSLHLVNRFELASVWGKFAIQILLLLSLLLLFTKKHRVTILSKTGAKAPPTRDIVLDAPYPRFLQHQRTIPSTTINVIDFFLIHALRLNQLNQLYLEFTVMQQFLNVHSNECP